MNQRPDDPRRMLEGHLVAGKAKDENHPHQHRQPVFKNEPNSPHGAWNKAANADAMILWSAPIRCPSPPLGAVVSKGATGAYSGKNSGRMLFALQCRMAMLRGM